MSDGRDDIEVVAEARSLPAAYRGIPESPRFTIVRRWRSRLTAGTHFGTAAVAGAGCALMAVTAGAPIVLAVAACVGGLAALLAYTGTCYVVDRTVVTAADGVLSIRHAPLPWFGGRRIAAEAIRGVYAMANPEFGTSTYEVHALLHDGTDLRLVADLPDRDAAETIARALVSQLQSTSK